MTKDLICIVCPVGCRMTAEFDENGNLITVKGNTCIRGFQYAQKELLNPERMLTSTVALKNGLYKRLPVITSSQVPKEMLLTVMNEINQIEVCAPIQLGDIIIRNVCGLDVNIIASRSMKRVEH